MAGHILVHPLDPSRPRRGNDQIMKAGGKGRELFNVTHFAARFVAAEVSHGRGAARGTGRRNGLGTSAKKGG